MKAFHQKDDDIILCHTVGKALSQVFLAMYNIHRKEWNNQNGKNWPQTTSCLLKMKKKKEDHKLLSNQAALSNSEHSYYKIKRL
jgi:hypothetical protein